MTTDSPNSGYSKALTTSLSRTLPVIVLGLHGYTIVKRTEPELRMYLVAVNDETGHQMAVATCGFAYTEKSTTGIRSTVHGLSAKATEDFDARLAKFPELEGFVSFTASHGTYENTSVMIAPIAEIREPGVAKPGSQFTLGRSGNRLMFDFAQRALVLPGSMLAENLLSSKALPRTDPAPQA